MLLYCIYSNHDNEMKIKTLKTLRESQRHYVFSYDENLEIDFVRKDMMNKIWKFKHKQASVIITDNKRQFKSNIDIMTKKEMLSIKKRQNELTSFKNDVRSIIQQYVL